MYPYFPKLISALLIILINYHGSNLEKLKEHDLQHRGAWMGSVPTSYHCGAYGKFKTPLSLTFLICKNGGKNTKLTVLG